MTLDRLVATDPCYGKIRTLEQRLLCATNAGTIKWTRDQDGYEWTTPHGVVQVGDGSLAIWNDSGVRIRHYKPESNELLAAVASWHGAMVGAAIDAILDELEKEL